jgi:hypothetical protein
LLKYNLKKFVNKRPNLKVTNSTLTLTEEPSNHQPVTSWKTGLDTIETPMLHVPLDTFTEDSKMQCDT